jgi:hypothetical protein
MSGLALGIIQSLWALDGVPGGSFLERRECETESLAPTLTLKIGRVEPPFPVSLVEALNRRFSASTITQRSNFIFLFE